MNDELIPKEPKVKIIPADFSLLLNQKNRVLLSQTPIFTTALLDPKHKLHFRIDYNSGIQGVGVRQWVEIRCMNCQGVYTLVYGVVNNYVTFLWAVITPSGKGYSVDQEGRGMELDQDTREALTKLLILPLTESIWKKPTKVKKK